MGNVPTKENRPRASSLSSGAAAAGSSSRSSRRHTTASFPSLTGRNSGKSDDRARAKEKHCMNLVVRYTECVDGGYLAPYGTYKSNLDFDSDIVRRLIVERRLAPFYTPLQDFDSDWTDDELVTLVRQSHLHALDSAYLEDEDADDLDDHKIHRSSNWQKRQDSKRRHQEMLARVRAEQDRCELSYHEARTSGTPNKHLMARDLILRLYKDATECPICFLYFPNVMNYSRCCRQPICTECFVQIKRLDPHPPHDDNSNTNEGELPHTLISDYANCPYCASTNFGVTYVPPLDISVGIGSNTDPADFKLKRTSGEEEAVEFAEVLPLPKGPRVHRKSSVAAESDLVITTDDIRPDWGQKLTSARSRLARKAAAASAIHASNLIIDEGSSNRNNAANARFMTSIEDKMMEEAIRLSILDEEERRSKSKSSSK